MPRSRSPRRERRSATGRRVRRSSAGTSCVRSRSSYASGARRRASSSPPRRGSRSALALGETDAAVEMGFFVAGEGRRSYGRTTTASMPHRTVLTLRRPVGVAALLISFNTPLPNVAWKAFPSIFCGNGSVLKPSEHAPVSAWWLGRLCLEAGLPPGVLNVIQGVGPEAGMPLVEDSSVDLVSFTGSAATGRLIAEAAGRRLAKTVMELGGKNALVVCDDADLDRAVEWTLASAFSNAGQRCAAASRIVVFDAVYESFREGLLAAMTRLDAVGPVISEQSMERILGAVETASAAGATVLAGGSRVGERGWHVAPTVVEGVSADAPLACDELFGPVAALYRVSGFEEAVALVERLAVRAHGCDPHRERPSRAALRGAGRGGRRGRQRRNARQRAAHGLRRRQAVRDGLEGGGASSRSTSTPRPSTSTSSSTPSWRDPALASSVRAALGAGARRCPRPRWHRRPGRRADGRTVRRHGAHRRRDPREGLDARARRRRRPSPIPRPWSASTGPCPCSSSSR